MCRRRPRFPFAHEKVSSLLGEFSILVGEVEKSSWKCEGW